ncbi:ABC transporter ATP-binding protein [Prosthecobacter dejongeii]|uniref:ABC-2 type transport system ATP-binding protein n=1 Tax=Prosthecobacter dejongeii TaxID=48465 RepID=A0A7W7YLZ9_9BACT|nr:ABC transporter ATP-binding protein [Prosthecobacter dejongeii]MBB5038653.1 ABC-2 type transport system ATP-binding protein [Prosthecobacter dejongeii]
MHQTSHPPAEMDRSQPAIVVENLQRSFGTLQAVQGVSFSIGHGQVVGFVGANGAGKTTTMRILATLDYPNEGTVKIGGHNVVHYPDKVRRLLGWMPDSFGTYEHMTVLEYLDFYARALGYKGQERLKRIQEVMDFTDLTPLADRMSNKMSKGQTQRLCLGRSLLHDPQILIMDEPAAGLDPKARVELKQLIRILAEEGKTILISSHILSELGEMCDSLLFIDKGRIVHHGDAESMTRGSAATAETLVTVQVVGDPAKLVQWALTAPLIEVVEETKRGARLRVQSVEEGTLAGVLRRMITDGLQVTDFHREERKLEDAFIDMLGQIDKGTFKGDTP